MAYDNTNKGVLFFEEEPESERHPNYKGNLNVDGKEYWMSAWDKVSKDGTKNFISISIKPKEDWVKPEVRDKFKKDDVVAVDEDQEVNLNDIPF